MLGVALHQSQMQHWNEPPLMFPAVQTGFREPLWKAARKSNKDSKRTCMSRCPRRSGVHLLSSLSPFGHISKKNGLGWQGGLISIVRRWFWKDPEVPASHLSTDSISLVERTNNIVFSPSNLSFTPLPPPRFIAKHGYLGINRPMYEVVGAS